MYAIRAILTVWPLLFLLTVLPSKAVAAQCDDGVVFNGPISITGGGTYSGNWQSTDPNTPAVNIHTTEPVTIINSVIKGPGFLIYDAAWGLGSNPSDISTTPGSTLTVLQSCFVGTNPNVLEAAKQSGIYVRYAASVDVERCDFESVGGSNILVEDYAGNSSLSNSIKVKNNRIHNIDGKVPPKELTPWANSSEVESGKGRSAKGVEVR